MNYLELCRRTNSIVGFQGVVSSVDATGYQETLTTAVRDAYKDIQRYRKDWDWMKKNKTVNVGDAQDEYTLQELWGEDTVDLAEYRYINYEGRRLPELDFDMYHLSDWTDRKEPRLYSINPAGKSLLVSPLDAVYQVDLFYIRTLHELSGNNDTPLLPERHQQLIIYMAIVKISTFIGNGTLYDMYTHEAAKGMGQLMREENPYREVRKRPIA